MKKIIALAAAVMAIAVAGAPAVSNAQATRTWVSGVGDDANPCSRTAPCKTFAGAISKTAAGGEIDVLDPGGFGAVTITKSIIIGTDPSLGGVLNAATNGVIINALATDTVTLRGLVIGGPTLDANTGLNGVRILSAGAVNIEDCYIYGNKAAAPNGNGVLAVNSGGMLKLSIVDTVFSENGSATDGGGVVVMPNGSGSAQVTLHRITAVDNARGVRLDATNTTGSVRGVLSNSNLTNNALAGIHVTSNGSVSNLYIVDSISSDNAGGVNSIGAGAVAIINRSSFYGNNVGLQPLTGGQILSYSNNAVVANSTDGAPTGTVVPK